MTELPLENSPAASTTDYLFAIDKRARDHTCNRKFLSSAIVSTTLQMHTRGSLWWCRCQGQTYGVPNKFCDELNQSHYDGTFKIDSTRDGQYAQSSSHP